MDKKIIFIAIIIILCIFIVVLKSKKEKAIDIVENNIVDIVENDSGKYIVKNSDGEEIEVESETEARWYLEHPGYNPEPVHIEGENEPKLNFDN